MPKERDVNKLFVGGLDKNKVTDGSFKTYFEKFGEIREVFMGKSRGFGFVAFEYASAAKKCLDAPSHLIDGAKVVVQAVTDKGTKHSKTGNRTTGEDIEVDKIYVGGLCLKSTEATLASYFQDFGNVIGVEIKKAPNGMSRGFGFVTFDNPDSVTDVINCNPHRIDGKSVDASRAISETSRSDKGNMHSNSRPPIQTYKSAPRNSPNSKPEAFKPPPQLARPLKRPRDNEEDESELKLFLGGLSPTTTVRDVRHYFCQFGEITDAIVMKNPKTNKPKGFGFVTFSEPFMANSALHQHEHRVCGRVISVKASVPRDVMQAHSQVQPLKKVAPERLPKREEPCDVNPPKEKTLIIGDSRVDHLKNRTHSSFFNTVDFVSLGEAKLGTIVEEMETRLTARQYKLVIIFAISYDITIQRFCPQTKVNVLDLEPDFSMDLLMERITHLKDGWSKMFPQVRFVWALPYVPDMPRFNAIRLAKVDCWDSPWSDAERMSCKIQLFKCYVEGIKTRWEVDSKNSYYVDLNYVMALGDDHQMATLMEGTLDDSVVCKVEDTVDGLNPSKIFANKFWFQVKKLEEFISSTLVDDPKHSLEDMNKFQDDYKKPLNNLNTKRFDDNNGGPSARSEKRFSSSGFDRSSPPRRDGPWRHGKPSRWEDGDSFERKDNRDRNEGAPNPWSRNEGNSRNSWNRMDKPNPWSSGAELASDRNRRQSPSTEGRTLLPSPDVFSSRDRDLRQPQTTRLPLIAERSNFNNLREEISLQNNRSQSSLTNEPHYSRRSTLIDENLIHNAARSALLEPVKSATTAIQSRLASEMESILPDVIKGVTEKIYSEVLKSMQAKGNNW